MRLLITAIVGCCAALVASQAPASLVLDLRFSDGSTTKDISALSAGDTVVIQVWAQVSGTNFTSTDDSLNGVYFGLMSSNADIAHLTGSISAGSFVAPFNASPPATDIGTFGDRNADTIGDWRGPSTTSYNHWTRASAGSFPKVDGGGSVGQQAGANTWEFHIADATFSIGTLTLPGPGTLDVLDFDLALLGDLGVFNPAKATWYEDGLGKGAYNGGILAAGNSVTFTLSGVPEPGSIAPAAAGFVGLAGYLLPITAKLHAADLDADCRLRVTCRPSNAS